MVHCIGGWVIGSARGWAAVDAAWLRAPVLEAARFRWATSRFSQTVRSAKMRRSSGTKPMPARATRYDSQPVMSTPLKATRPAWGGVSPMIERMVVDLPTPLRPSRQTHSPAPTSIETPNSTRDSPYAVWISLTSSSGAVTVWQPRGAPRLRRGASERWGVWGAGSGPPTTIGVSPALSEVDAAHLGVGAHGRRGAVGEPQRLQQAQRLVSVEVADRRERVPAAPAVRHERGLDVLVDGQLREDVGPLERAAHAHAAEVVRRHAGDVAPVEHDPPSVAAQVAGDQVEQRRLAGAVGPDDRAHAVLRHVERDARDGDEAVERLGEVAHLKHAAASRAGARAARGRHPARRESRTAARRGWCRARTASTRCRRRSAGSTRSGPARPRSARRTSPSRPAAS